MWAYFYPNCCLLLCCRISWQMLQRHRHRQLHPLTKATMFMQPQILPMHLLLQILVLGDRVGAMAQSMAPTMVTEPYSYENIKLCHFVNFYLLKMIIFGTLSYAMGFFLCFFAVVSKMVNKHISYVF